MCGFEFLISLCTFILCLNISVVNLYYKVAVA